jgi:hypothetical protein
MNIHSLDPKNALLDGAFPEYERGMNFFYLEQLVPLNLNIYFVEQIIQFPFGLFTVPEEVIFFRTVVHNFIDVGLLIITRVATDQKKGYTLLRFKNRVRDIIKPEYKDLFDQRMREVRFDAKTRGIFKKARDLRNERIAHLSEAYVTGTSTIEAVDFSDLKMLRDTLNSLLDALSFNVERVMLPIEYDPRVQHPVGTKHTTDIEKILDSVAQNSPLLKMHEEHPTRWTYQKNRLNDEEFILLNRYRKKFGLPEVSRL